MSRSEQLLKLVNAVEPAAEQLVEWLRLVSDTKGHHIRDLEDAVASQVQRGDALEARVSDLETQLRDVQGQLTVERAAAERAAAEAATKLSDETARARDTETRAAEKMLAVEKRAASLQEELEQLRASFCLHKGGIRKATCLP